MTKAVTAVVKRCALEMGPALLLMSCVILEKVTYPTPVLQLRHLSKEGDHSTPFLCY